jgi:50S ribosomal subunit-associated GTPase HflX
MKHCCDIPVILFANKMDLIYNTNIDTIRIQEFVQKYNFLKYFITSAKTGEGVIEVFNPILKN